MKLPDNHDERIARARLSLEGLAIGDAFGEMLAYNCAGARARVEKGLSAGPWFHTDDTEMALSIFETLRRFGRIAPNDLALRFSERFRRDPDRGYGTMARAILRDPRWPTVGRSVEISLRRLRIHGEWRSHAGDAAGRLFC